MIKKKKKMRSSSTPLQACKCFFSLIRAFVSPDLMFAGQEAGLVGQIFLQDALKGRQQNL